jgi:hypothetical protein
MWADGPPSYRVPVKADGEQIALAALVVSVLLSREGG